MIKEMMSFSSTVYGSGNMLSKERKEILMGLIKAGIGAVGGVLADQWK